MILINIKQKSFRYIIFQIFIFLIVCFFVFVCFADKQIKDDNYSKYLLEGRESFDNGKYEQAIILLTTSLERLPILFDYALLYRAKAMEKTDKIKDAIDDLKNLINNFPNSPLIKKARLYEIQLYEKCDETKIEKAYEDFTSDYPNHIEIKYKYALYLKDNKKSDKAKDLFKEVFLSSSSLSEDALKHLLPSDIDVDILIKKGKNLNNQWDFKSAEVYFKKALKKDISNKDEVLEGLAYSIFKQKRYSEASELYKKTGNLYWRAKALLRDNNIFTFEQELERILKTNDKRSGELLIALGLKKRRAGDITAAMNFFDKALNEFPSVRQDALWAKGWALYIDSDYQDASKIFIDLYSDYGDLKYLYWYNKCLEKTTDKKADWTLLKNGLKTRNFYSFLSMLKNNYTLPTLILKDLDDSFDESIWLERVNILESIGFRKEAINELIYLSKEVTSDNDLIKIILYLKKLGDYKNSINLTTKISYSEGLHQIFYPLAYPEDLKQFSEKQSIDKFLLLSVMREESRFDTEARSVVGALGLMQLMPNTAKTINRNMKDLSMLYKANMNISIGSIYLKRLLEEFQSIPIAVAAYNAGEKTVKNWIKTRKRDSTIDEFIEDIPYDETRNYVKKVTVSYFQYLMTQDKIGLSKIKKQYGNF